MDKRSEMQIQSTMYQAKDARPMPDLHAYRHKKYGVLQSQLCKFTCTDVSVNKVWPSAKLQAELKTLESLIYAPYKEGEMDPFEAAAQDLLAVLSM